MWSMPRIRYWVSVLLSVLLPVAAVAPHASATPDYAAPQHNWTSCEPMLGDVSDIPTARCTMVAVPINPSDSAAGTASLAVIRIPASGKRIGSLFVNPGGPGASAVDTAAAMGAALADTEITEHFDLVGFDPRGVGYSTPQTRCRTDAEFDAVAKRPDGRLQPRWCRAYRADVPAACRSVCPADGQVFPGHRGFRVGGAGHGRRPAGHR